MIWKGRPEYEPKTFEQRIGYLIEECGEVLAAAGKTVRWGPDSTNPELPPAERETNIDWLDRELDDLERAIRYARMACEQARAEQRGAARERLSEGEASPSGARRREASPEGGGT